jgi:cytochrome oxidase Cu insertion factor (SCO1/SenC/PrrC family)
VKFKLREVDLNRPKAIFICGASAFIIGIGMFLTLNRSTGPSFSIAQEIPANLSNNSSAAQIDPEIKDLLQKNSLRAAQNKTPAPDFELRDQDGKMVRLSQFRGETVLLGFFTTW